MRPLALLAVPVCAALLAGCSTDSPEPADPTPTASVSRPADAPTPPYGATLVAGDEEGTATLTNVGRRKDRYLIQVTPSLLGSASPAVVELEPGASVDVRYRLASADGVSGTPVLTAHSTTSGEDVELSLP